MDDLRSQKLDHGAPVVCDAGSTDFMEFGVQQLLQPSPIAANARVMKLDFKIAEVTEEIGHGGCVVSRQRFRPIGQWRHRP